MKFAYYQESPSYHHGPKTFSALHTFPRLQKPLTEGKLNNGYINWHINIIKILHKHHIDHQRHQGNHQKDAKHH